MIPPGVNSHPNLDQPRNIFAPAGRNAPPPAWLDSHREFTLDRRDFEQIPDHVWHHISELRRHMTSLGIGENRANRELRILAELIDDALTYLASQR